MQGHFVKICLFTVVLLAGFAYLGRVVTSVSGGAVQVVEGVGPEAGEAIFWGKGTCYTCHAVGDRGGAIRGPNQGDSGPLGIPIGTRAEARAVERTEQSGRSFTAIDYLLESLIEPNVYVVEGYKAEMPEVHLPPVALDADEIKAVVAYLVSQGGDAEQLQVEQSPFWETVKAATAAGAVAEPFALYTPGDPEAGRALFYSTEETACSRCHVIDGEGGQVGPELTMVAATRSVPFIVESILEPGATVASGFEQTMISLADWSEISGVKKEETDETLVIADTLGELHTIQKSEIDTMEEIPGSVMPENFGELLTVDEFHDLVSFVLTLKGETAVTDEEPAPAAEEGSD